MLSKILHDLGNEEFCPTYQSMQRCNPHRAHKCLAIFMLGNILDFII